MNTNRGNILYQALSYKIVGLAMEVHRKLGYGFLEKVYENAMMVLFQREGIRAKQQISVKVYFEGVEVGYYVADIMVEDKIITELKAAENLVDGTPSANAELSESNKHETCPPFEFWEIEAPI